MEYHDTYQIVVESRVDLQLGIHTDSMFVSKTGSRLFSVDMLAHLLHQVAGINTHVSIHSEGGNPAKRRSGVASFDQKLGSLFSFVAGLDFLGIDVKLGTTHLNCLFGIAVDLKQALHNMNCVCKGWSVLGNAVHRLISNTSSFTELAIHDSLTSVLNMGLSKNMEVQIHVVQQFGVKCNVFQFVRDEAVTVIADRLDIYIKLGLFLCLSLQ